MKRQFTTPVFTAVFLHFKSKNTLCRRVFLWLWEQRRRKKHSAFDGTSRSSLIFLIDFLLLSVLRSQGRGCLNWSRLTKGGAEKWRNRLRMKGRRGRESKKKKKRDEGGGRGWSPRLRLTPDLDRDPGVCPRRSEVVWKCHGGDSLYCWVMVILCSLPSLSDMISVALLLASPEGLASVSNRATRGPLRAPYRQSRRAAGTGTRAERTGEATRQKGCFISSPIAPAGLLILLYNGTDPMNVFIFSVFRLYSNVQELMRLFFFLMCGVPTCSLRKH